MPVIKILGLGWYMDDGLDTPFDGEYVVEYDPTRHGVDPEGHAMYCHLVTTADKRKAKHFATHAEALEAWNQAHGLRADGEPNRPLTAFTVEILPDEPAPIAVDNFYVGTPCAACGEILESRHTCRAIQPES